MGSVVDVGVDAVGRRRCIRRMVGLHAPELSLRMARCPLGNLYGVHVAVDSCDAPVGIGPVGREGTVDEGCLHAAADIVVRRRAEQQVTATARVLGGQVVDSLRHRCGMVHHEAHGTVAHDGLRAPRLALGQILACADVVEVVLLACLQRSELTLRQFTLFDDGAEVAPYVHRCQLRLRALQTAERGLLKVSTLEGRRANLYG